MDLFATGTAPERLDPESQKILHAGIAAIYRESDSSTDFEGRIGVSPREVRTLLLDAAQSVEHACLSPFAVLHELDELSKRTSEYEWLKEKPLSGGYHDHRLFRELVRTRLLDTIEEEMRTASGLVDETRYGELFDRYIANVGTWVKGEKVRNPHTGEFESADERMMREVEGLLAVRAKPEDHRRGLISAIAAWAIDHPGKKIVNSVVFPQQMRKLREAVFADRRKGVALVVNDLAILLQERKEGEGGQPAHAKGLREEQRQNALVALERLKTVGYCDACALDAASAVLRARFAELVT